MPNSFYVCFIQCTHLYFLTSSFSIYNRIVYKPFGNSVLGNANCFLSPFPSIYSSVFPISFSSIMHLS
uniref:Uncharacterized protein n=1 Tax=Rhizophora mucronata TaxID=61149 RepID=A0A2P2PJU7_RHIMU